MRQSKEKRSFEAKLRHSFGFSFQKYQLLEFLFRQGMMLSGYTYDLESQIHSKLLVPGQAKNLIEHSGNEIKRWETNTSGLYGLEGIAVTEIHEHSFLVEEFNRILRELSSQERLRSKLISKDILVSFRNTLESKLRDLLQYKGEQGRGYVTFDKNGFANTVTTQFDYFSRYIYVANAVFKKPIELAAGAADNNKLGVAAFISEKIQFEHSQIDGINRFRASLIKDRLKSGKRSGEESSNFLGYFKNYDEFISMLFSYN